MAEEWVRPLDKMPAAGIVWWQGESNIENAGAYKGHLRKLVLEWRKCRQDPAFRFVIIGLQKMKLPGEIKFAAIRKAQKELVKELNDTLFVPSSKFTKNGVLHPPENELENIGQSAAELVTSKWFNVQYMKKINP